MRFGAKKPSTAQLDSLKETLFRLLAEQQGTGMVLLATRREVPRELAIMVCRLINQRREIMDSYVWGKHLQAINLSLASKPLVAAFDAQFSAIGYRAAKKALRQLVRHELEAGTLVSLHSGTGPRRGFRSVMTRHQAAAKGITPRT